MNSLCMDELDESAFPDSVFHAPAKAAEHLCLTFKIPMLSSLGCTFACLLDRRPLLFDKLGKMRCARTRSINSGMKMPED